MATRSSGDPSGSGDEREPTDEQTSPAASTFDAAKDLLASALEEVRAVPEPPATPPAARPERAPGTSAEDAAAFWAKPAPAAPPTPVSDDAADLSPATARRRRRRAQSAPGAAYGAASGTEPEATSESEELDDLSETVFQSPAGRRRRRRPVSATADDAGFPPESVTAPTAGITAPTAGITAPTAGITAPTAGGTAPTAGVAAPTAAASPTPSAERTFDVADPQLPDAAQRTWKDHAAAQTSTPTTVSAKPEDRAGATAEGPGVTPVPAESGTRSQHGSESTQPTTTGTPTFRDYSGRLGANADRSAATPALVGAAVAGRASASSTGNDKTTGAGGGGGRSGRDTGAGSDPGTESSWRDYSGRLTSPSDAAIRTGAASAGALTAAAKATDPVVADTTTPRRTSPPRDRRRRSPWLIAAAIVAVLAVGVAALVASSGSDSDQTAVGSGGKARLTFAPVTTTSGATVTRTWELQGSNGDEFIGTLAITNPTDAPVLTTFTEVIPKQIAANVADITFDPEPIVVKADPVVVYRLTVAPGATTTVTYQADVAPDGADQSRLEAWARKLPDTTSTTSTTTTSTTTTTTAPAAPATVPTTTPSRTPVTVAPTSPPTSPPAPPPPPPAPTTGTIVLSVVSRGQGGTFGFSTPGGNITLTTPGPDISVSWSGTVGPGTYTLSQISTPAFFYLAQIRCSNGFTANTPTTAVAVSVGRGETVTCYFDNRPR